MSASTGNIFRDALLKQAIQWTIEAGEIASVETVAACLPADFDLREAELHDFLADAQQPESDALGLEPVPEAPAPGPASAEDAQAAVVAAHNTLIQARARVLVVSEHRRRAADALARAITQFQRGIPSCTPTQALHDFCHSEQELRRRVASGEITPTAAPRPANSAIDRLNAGGRGTVDSGYGRGYRRGAHGRENFGRKVEPRST